MPGVPPVPIPNTAVKPRAANGSRTIGPARVGRCQVYGPVCRKTNRASFLSEWIRAQEAGFACDAVQSPGCPAIRREIKILRLNNQPIPAVWAKWAHILQDRSAMRALILTCSAKHPKLPLRLFEEQLVAGPYWPDAQTLHGQWRSLRTSLGDYDVADLLAKIPADQYPDVILCLLDRDPASRPRNLQCFHGRKILIAAHGPSGTSDFDHGGYEPFDQVIRGTDRCSIKELVHRERLCGWERAAGIFDLPRARAC